MYKKSYKLRNFLAFCALFCLSFGGIWAQEDTLLTDLDFSKTPYAWLSVLSGSAVCRPIKAPYGWLDLTEGKMASAFTESGTVLWQQSLPAQATPLASCGQDGFALAVLKGKRLCLLNPSGLCLWQKALDFEPKFCPLVGRDGRFFVFGKDAAACFGINGAQKWKQKFEALNTELEPRQLDDGSLLLFLEEAQGSKTVGLRISPFGETLEKIIFAGRVTGAGQSQSGLLLSFADGSLGLCCVEQNEAKSKWVIKDLGLGQKVRFLQLDGQRLAAVWNAAGGAKVAVVNAKKAAAERVFAASKITDCVYAEAAPEGIFLAAADFGELYSLDGKRIRGAAFAPKTKKLNWDYALYAKGGTVIFTSKNWSLVGWRLLKASQAQKAPAPSSAIKRANYKDFYKDCPNDYKQILAGASEARKAALQKGNYAAAEKEFLYASQAILDGYFEKSMKQKSVGGSIGALSDDELYGFSLSQESAAIGMLGLFGSSEAAKNLARVLAAKGDESVLTQALKAVQDCGYDPDGAVMDSIEALAKAALPSQETLLKELCAALYSVCRFMGRPAINKKGLKILAALQFPQYPNSTKEEARKVYEKLARLQL